MQTIIITIDPPQDTATGYRVAMEVLGVGPGGGASVAPERIETVLPADLGPLSAARAPDGQPWTPDSVARAYEATRGPSQVMESIGIWLADLALPDPLRTRCMALRGGTLRMMLNVRPPELRALPWELLSLDRHRLGIEETAPVARFRPEPNVSGGTVAMPMNILIVVGSSEDDITIRAEREVMRIRKELAQLGRRVDIEVLRRPSRAELIQQLKAFAPRILHFIGHGQRHPGGGAASLVIEIADANLSRYFLTGEELMHECRAAPPNLVVLNACHAARTAEGVHWSLVDAFAAAGVPAIVAMQTEVEEAHASTFSTSLYQSLCEGRSVDCAVSAARKAVYALFSDSPLLCRGWSIPSLTLTTHPDKAFRFTPDLPPARLLDLTTAPAMLKGFVNRSGIRRELWRLLDGSPAPRDLVVIKGPAQTGKTSLGLWVTNVCGLRGQETVCIDLKGDMRYVDSLAVMRLIRDGGDLASSDYVLQRGNTFAAFDRALPFLMRGQQVPEGNTPPPPFQWTDAFDGTEEDMKKLFALFRLGLQESARTRPLLITLDHCGAIQDAHFNNYIWPELLRPLARREISNVRGLVILGNDEYENIFRLGRYEGLFHKENIQNFSAQEYVPLIVEYLVLHGLDYDKAVQAANLLAQIRPPEPWPPKKLSDVLRACEMTP